MKIRKLNFYILFPFIVFSCCFFNSSCKKTTEIKTVTDTLQYAWKPIPSLNIYGTSALNSASIADSELVVSSTSNYIIFNITRAPFNYFTGYYLQGTSYFSPTNVVPFVNNNFCSFATSNAVVVQGVSVHNQFSSFTYTPVLNKESKYPIFPVSGIYPSGSYPSSTYPIIRNKYLIVPVETDTAFPHTARFDLLSFDSSQLLSPFATGCTPVVKSILLSPAPGTIGFTLTGYFCATYFDKFFVFYNGQFFRIDTSGNIKQFGYLPAPYSKGYGVYNMFTVGHTLYVNSQGVFFYSTDEGETWNLFNDFSNTSVGYLIFRNMGNKLYATIADNETQIWKVAITGNNLNLSEINNSGLENNIITSITQCGRYDFITTTSNVYYRDTSLIDQLKTPVR